MPRRTSSPPRDLARSDANSRFSFPFAKGSPNAHKTDKKPVTAPAPPTPTPAVPKLPEEGAHKSISAAKSPVTPAELPANPSEQPAEKPAETLPRKRERPSKMTEPQQPPAKRAKRTDSAAMWDRDEKNKPVSSKESQVNGRHAEQRDRAEDTSSSKRGGGEEIRRRDRSRSRDRHERRRERSRSRDRGAGRGRDGDRGGRRDRERGKGGDRDRSGSRERHRPRRDYPRKEPDRHRDRSRSPVRNGTSVRTRSPPRGPRVDRAKEAAPPVRDGDRGRDGARKEAQATTHERPSDAKSKPVSIMKSKSASGDDATQVDKPKPNGTHDKMEVDESEEDALIRKMMGFTNFRSTQNTKVPGNNVYGVRKEKKTEYRQYMNRVGGFNRPLSPSR